MPSSTHRTHVEFTTSEGDLLFLPINDIHLSAYTGRTGRDEVDVIVSGQFTYVLGHTYEEAKAIIEGRSFT